MKRILPLFLVLAFNLILITGCSETQNISIASGEPLVLFTDISASPQSIARTTQEKLGILNYVVIQRGKDSLRVGFQNDSSDKLRTLGTYGLVSDIENLLWIVSHGSVGIYFGDDKKKITELPVVQESNKINAEGENIWFINDVSSKNVWIRLHYEPFIPEQGMNVWGHKDLIVYMDTENHDNAFLGIQDVQNPNLWRIVLLPGYGPWLEKEIEMFLRLTIAM